MRKLIFSGLMLFGGGGVDDIQAVQNVYPDESGVIEQFKGYDQSSNLRIRYDALNYLLSETVFDSGPSSRRYISRPNDRVGTKIKRANRSFTRLDGNRVFFESFLGTEIDRLTSLREDLETIPSVVPLHEMTRNEQLAYWLNLYNITVMEQVALTYPGKRKLKKLLYGSKKRSGILERKLLNIEGVSLSLNDIRYNILIPKYQTPLVMYGLWDGVVGAPKIRPTAFNGQTVYEDLADNARSFVNSQSGVRYRSSNKNKLIVSKFYEDNRALFPDFERDLHRHLMFYASPRLRLEITNRQKFRFMSPDWFITDFRNAYLGVGNSANTNVATLVFNRSNGSQGDGGLDARFGDKIVPETNLPPHIVEYREKVRRKNLATIKQRGSVTIQNIPNRPTISVKDLISSDNIKNDDQPLI